MNSTHTTTAGAASLRPLSGIVNAEQPSPLRAYAQKNAERIATLLERGGFLKAKTEPINWRCAALAFAALRGGLRPGAVITGATGRGKTCLAEALKSRAGGCAMSNVTVDFGGEWEPWQLHQDFRSPEPEDTVRNAGNACIWFLDDVGAEEVVKHYGNTSDCFARFIMRWDRLSTRHKYFNPLLITTNLTKEEMTTRYGERIVSRLLPLAWCPFSGHDKREMTIAVPPATTEELFPM